MALMVARDSQYFRFMVARDSQHFRFMVARDSQHFRFMVARDSQHFRFMVLQPNLVSGCTFILPFSVPNFNVFYNNFHTLTKKMKKLSQFSKAHISETPSAI